MRFCPSLKFCQKNKHRFFTDFQYFCSKNSFCTKIIAKGTSDFKTMWAVLCYVLILIFNFNFCFYFYFYFYFLFFIFIGCLYFYFCILLFVFFFIVEWRLNAHIPAQSFFGRLTILIIGFGEYYFHREFSQVLQIQFIKLFSLNFSNFCWDNMRGEINGTNAGNT
jgi:hypothetical protein